MRYLARGVAFLRLAWLRPSILSRAPPHCLPRHELVRQKDPNHRHRGLLRATLWNVLSGLMFAVRMTLAHFSVSLARNFPKSAGELGDGTNPPRSARRALWRSGKSPD